MKSGLVALVGRPNVGKSTLLNALLGRKVAIMSSKPQTTRSVIRGVLRRPEGEAVLVDTPGLHKPRTLLGQRLNDLVRGTLTEVDLVCFMVDADAGIGRGDRFLAAALAGVDTPKLALVNKMDAASRERTVPSLQTVSELGDWAEVVPISALTGEQLDVLTQLIFRHLPEGPSVFPEGRITDEPERHFVAEVIREKAISAVREELPHSIAVVVDEMGPPEEVPIGPGDQAEPGERGERGERAEPGGRAERPAPRRDLLVVRADLFVERSSQKPIVLGRGGSVLRDIGTAARKELEQVLGTRIYLDLHVKVAKEWQRDPKQLTRLGY
ncbi:MAG TPA: GTPase Era [Actinomycetes bacterium]|nr:GTPase Era [Actinomycetes bacterium]